MRAGASTWPRSGWKPSINLPASASPRFMRPAGTRCSRCEVRPRPAPPGRDSGSPPLDQHEADQERGEDGLGAQDHGRHPEYDATHRHEGAVTGARPVPPDLDLEAEPEEESDAAEHDAPLEREPVGEPHEPPAG